MRCKRLLTPGGLRRFVVAIALCTGLSPASPEGDPDAVALVLPVLDSGGGESSGDGVRLKAASLGGSVQSGAATGPGLRLEVGWVGWRSAAGPHIRGDFNGDGSVGFPDFLLFAAAYGSARGGPDYDARFDLDGDDAVGFPDFLAFAAAYGR